MPSLAMTIAADLYALQEIDAAFEAAKASLAAVEEQLGESEELVAARRAVDDARGALGAVSKQQRELEWQVDDLRSRLSSVENKLYGGSVRNPKELGSMQEEANILRGQLRRREDELLDLMVRVEERQTAVQGAEEALAAVEKRWRQEQKELASQKELLEAELAGLGERREQQSRLVGAKVLALYENLRERRQGKAVAKVERGMCGGCRISLPMTVLQKARSGLDVVQCVSCERILYVS
ncbi:MAG: zinc ribbon domain-containing protein [Dehalococcoidia bacterium]